MEPSTELRANFPKKEDILPPKMQTIEVHKEALSFISSLSFISLLGLSFRVFAYKLMKALFIFSPFANLIPEKLVVFTPAHLTLIKGKEKQISARANKDDTEMFFTLDRIIAIAIPSRAFCITAVHTYVASFLKDER